jgi:hypothetical protein
VDNLDKSFGGARCVPILSAVTRGNALLAALVLSATLACSDPEAGTLPSVSPSPLSTSATASQNPTATSRSSAAENAVRTYYAALQGAVHDPRGGLNALRRTLADECECRKILDVLREEARKGRHADYTLVITKLSVPDMTTTRATVRVTVDQSAGNLYDSTGGVVERIPARMETFFIDLRRAEPLWLITRVTAQ